MRKIIVPAMCLVLFFIVVEQAQATRLYQESGIFPNRSAEYVRTQNRSASISVDAAYYNPAGLAFMEKTGLSLMYSNQTYVVRKEHTLDYYAIQAGDYEPVQTFLQGMSSAADCPNITTPRPSLQCCPIYTSFIVTAPGGRTGLCTFMEASCRGRATPSFPGDWRS
jgi:hypothetical protein